MEGCCSPGFKVREVQVTGNFSAVKSYRTKAIKQNGDLCLQFAKSGLRDDEDTPYWEVAADERYEIRVITKPVEPGMALPAMRITTMLQQTVRCWDPVTQDPHIEFSRYTAAVSSAQAARTQEMVAGHHAMDY